MNNPNTAKNNRIKRELREMSISPPENITACLMDDNDINKWKATIIGPKDTLYENIKYELILTLPPNYPFSPPTVKFITKILHVNVKNGDICLDILKTTWSPVLSISKLLLCISTLLSDPNFESIFDMDAAELYKANRKEFAEKVKELAKEKYSFN